MLDFSGNDEKARSILIHYAKQLGNDFILDLAENNKDVRNKEESVELAQFYWKMLDASAEDKENEIIVLGERDLQFWMGRLMNIIGGYLTKRGYEYEWNKACDEA